MGDADRAGQGSSYFRAFLRDLPDEIALARERGLPVELVVEAPLPAHAQRLMDTLGVPVEVRAVNATVTNHGTKYGYDKGCRCDACSEAKMRARRAARDRNRAANTPAYQRELAASRERKESYRGTCEHCGTATTGCNGPGSAPTVCAACAPAVYGPRYAAEQRGRGPTVERVLALLDGRDLRMSEIATGVGITHGHASNVLHRLVRYGLIVRVRHGVYRRAA